VDVVLQIGATFFLDHPQLLGAGIHHGVREGSGEEVREVVVHRLHHFRVLSEVRLLLRGELRVLLGDHPLRRSLEEGQVPHLVDDRAHDLNSGRSGAHDSNPATSPVEVVVPTGAVEDFALELLDA
jgi:hypothetical protein